MLTLKVRNDVLNYSNKIVNFSLYFEHRFEIYICFHHRNSNLRLIDILKWLDFHKNDVTLVSRNQISCVSDISECYLATQLELGFSTLDFYKSLIL